MPRRSAKNRSLRLFSVVLSAAFIIGANSQALGRTETLDKFETVRASIQAWLSQVDAEKFLITAPDLKNKIVDDWSHKREKYQIVSVRKPEDDNRVGRIPKAITVYWRDLLKDESLARLDVAKDLVIYCYYGNASIISYTILSLLGYKCQSLNFGMMSWNLKALAREPWDGEANYQVETSVNTSAEAYPLPTIHSQRQELKALLMDEAGQYLARPSPALPSSEIKTIVDDWDHKASEYQIVSVRAKAEEAKGHVPHSINVPLSEMARVENLKKLDPHKTIIVYSDNGQTGQMAAVVLSLLGYKAVNMIFGMMDWNAACVDKSKQWAGAAEYPVTMGNE